MKKVQVAANMHNDFKDRAPVTMRMRQIQGAKQ